MNVIHFGAGNIGKGFIANVLSNNGFHVCFVDVDKTNIQTIRQANKYTIEVLESPPKLVEITGVSILDSLNDHNQIVDQLCHADLITTSVGVNNLAKIAPVIIQGLIARFAQQGAPINIIANENAINATNILKQAIIELLPVEHADIVKKVGFVNSAIDRQAVTRSHDGIMITAVEPFWEWVINQKEMVTNQLPKMVDVTYVDDLQPYIEKKLYIVNLGHAALAYLGFIANKATILDTLSVATFKQFVKATMQDSAKYLIAKYPFTEEYLNEYIDNTLNRFSNPNLKDSVLRVANSPIRKLGKNERLIGPLLQLHHLHLPINNLCKVIAMAMLFSDENDPQATTLQNFIHQNGIEVAIEQYCHIQDAAIIAVIKNYYNMLLPITRDNSDVNRITRIEQILFK